MRSSNKEFDTALSAERTLPISIHYRETEGATSPRARVRALSKQPVKRPESKYGRPSCFGPIVICMSRILLTVAAVVLLTEAMLAQLPSSDAQLTFVRLQAPAYPPIAMAARVWGDVILSVTLATDGTAESVTVDSGPQMLRQAAVDSAKGSRFQPVGEGKVDHVYKLVYKFSFEVLPCFQAPDQSYPQVKVESNTVAISGQSVPICDPAADRRVRSPKCLFLWKCGLKAP